VVTTRTTNPADNTWQRNTLEHRSRNCALKSDRFFRSSLHMLNLGPLTRGRSPFSCTLSPASGKYKCGVTGGVEYTTRP
jgi:hypothetical protein